MTLFFRRANRFQIAIATIILIVAVYAYVTGQKRPCRQSFFVFNTTCNITIYGQSQEKCNAVIKKCIDELQALNDCINAYDPQSELCHMNANAGKAAFQCSDRLWEIISGSRDAWEKTEGAFDPSVGPLMKLWGFHGKKDTVPSQTEIDAAMKLVGLDKIQFDDDKKQLFFGVDGMSLDFGGIAKGYACDVISQILLDNGIDIYIIDLGGNLMLSEKTPSRFQKFKIGIADPNHKGSVITERRLSDCAIATSGNYERSRIINGVRVGHIMDPASGHPGKCHLSVSAITKKGIDSDVFSTAVFVRGKELAEKLAAQLPGTHFIIVDEDKTEEL